VTLKQKALLACQKSLYGVWMTKLKRVISRLSSAASLLLNLRESPRQSESGIGI
jgi:hypothetical protein